MHDLLESLIASLEKELGLQNKERARDELPRIAKARLVVLGQFSLLSDPELSRRLPLAATMDFDAWIEGEWCVRAMLKRILAEKGLAYDELSAEIWMPKETTYRTIHDSEMLKVQISDVISTLVSKAVKAPEKNRILVREALKIFGSPLSKAIVRHGGDLEFFREA
jgi:hypothetical protein